MKVRSELTKDGSDPNVESLKDETGGTETYYGHGCDKRGRRRTE